MVVLSKGRAVRKAVISEEIVFLCALLSMYLFGVVRIMHMFVYRVPLPLDSAC